MCAVFLVILIELVVLVAQAAVAVLIGLMIVAVMVAPDRRSRPDTPRDCGGPGCCSGPDCPGGLCGFDDLDGFTKNTEPTTSCCRNFIIRGGYAVSIFAKQHPEALQRPPALTNCNALLR